MASPPFSSSLGCPPPSSLRVRVGGEPPPLLGGRPPHNTIIFGFRTIPRHWEFFQDLFPASPPPPPLSPHPGAEGRGDGGGKEHTVLW